MALSVELYNELNPVISEAFGRDSEEGIQISDNERQSILDATTSYYESHIKPAVGTAETRFRYYKSNVKQLIDSAFAKAVAAGTIKDSDPYHLSGYDGLLRELKHLEVPAAIPPSESKLEVPKDMWDELGKAMDHALENNSRYGETVLSASEREKIINAAHALFKKYKDYPFKSYPSPDSASEHISLLRNNIGQMLDALINNRGLITEEVKGFDLLSAGLDIQHDDAIEDIAEGYRGTRELTEAEKHKKHERDTFGGGILAIVGAFSLIILLSPLFDKPGRAWALGRWLIGIIPRTLVALGPTALLMGGVYLIVNNPIEEYREKERDLNTVEKPTDADMRRRIFLKSLPEDRAKTIGPMLEWINDKAENSPGI